MISIVIPTYNAAAAINKVLDAVYRQSEMTKDEYEVLVVDDCSSDNTVELVKKFPVRLINLEKRSGPADARNRGLREANSELIVFLDSDVVLKEDALIKIKKRFAEKPGISGLVGIYAKKAANEGPFRSYLALRKYSNWFDPKREFISFLVVSIGAIKKNIFLEFGGFDTRYRGADVEDFELGYRITEKYKILLADDIQGYHYFPSFSKTAKNFFKRSFQWIELFTARRQFSSEAATTKKRAFSNLAGFVSFIMLLCSVWHKQFVILFLFGFLVFLAGNIKFYNFILKEKGVIFLLYALMLDYIFSVVVGIAALLSILNQCRLAVIRK